MNGTAGDGTPDRDAHPLGELSQRAFDIWLKHEEVAMHFNDLLMRWRLQAISGLAALVTLGGLVVGNVKSPEQRYWGMLLLSVTFFCVWVGLAVLDLSYYGKLLRGAVDEIKAIEKKIPINLSTRIEDLAEAGGKCGPWWFYCFGAIPIVLIFGYSVHRINNPPAPASPQVSCNDALDGAVKSCKHARP